MTSLIPLAEIPTASLLYKLGHLQPPTTKSPPTASQFLNDKIALIRTDITKLRVDTIVNAANQSLLGGGGVDGAIHRAAGPGLVRECETLDGCETGSAKITNAYNLPCQKVIHAVGPIYWAAKETNTHATKLRGCYRRSLELAVENGLKSIAFSALSTGVYGYPSEEAAETAIREVKRFLEGESGAILERVVFCSFEKKDEIAYEKWIPRFFPPTEKDLSTSHDAQGASSAKTVADLPDPPTAEPASEGQPDAKKQKVTHEDEGWEEIERPNAEAENGAAEEVKIADEGGRGKGSSRVS
ncbi:MAG: hypothetical protein M1833_000150 [Piccolia ochrophora]|nr:MAG: hypothetical protein M1833_000150 [Piccolia ochrophora]